MVPRIIIHPLESFTSPLADGFSLESEWKQVSSSLQDSIIIIIITLLLPKFFSLIMLMVFYWSLCESEPLQVSRTLCSIVADFNKAAVWMVSFLSLISNSSSLFFKSSRTIPSTIIIIGITITFKFHNFFCSLARFKYCLSFSEN